MFLRMTYCLQKINRKRERQYPKYHLLFFWRDISALGSLPKKEQKILSKYRWHYMAIIEPSCLKQSLSFASKAPFWLLSVQFKDSTTPCTGGSTSKGILVSSVGVKSVPNTIIHLGSFIKWHARKVHAKLLSKANINNILYHWFKKQLSEKSPK